MAFAYAKRVLSEQSESNLRFYMVGDYPEIDIAGGKQNGMETVLVESGVYDKNEIDIHQEYMKYADHIVPNIMDAVDLILKENKIC